MLTIKKVAILPLMLVILILISACSGQNEVSDQITVSGSSSSNGKTVDGQAIYPIQNGGRTDLLAAKPDDAQTER